MKTERGTRVELAMRIQRFHLPPVQSALIVGRRAGIGPQAMSKALAEMFPGAFTLVAVDHPVVEAVVVRTSHLRTVPQERLVPILLARCEAMMDESDMLHVMLDVTVHSVEEIEV